MASQNNIAALEAEVTKWKRMYDSADEEVNRAYEETRLRGEKVEEWKEKYEKLKEEKAEIESTVDAKEENYKHLENKWIEKDKEAKKLSNDVESLKKQKKNAESLLGNSEVARQRAEDDFKILRSDMDGLMATAIQREKEKHEKEMEDKVLITEDEYSELQKDKRGTDSVLKELEAVKEQLRQYEMNEIPSKFPNGLPSRGDFDDLTPEAPGPKITPKRTFSEELLAAPAPVAPTTDSETQTDALVGKTDSEAQTDALMGKTDAATQVGRVTGDADTQTDALVGKTHSEAQTDALMGKTDTATQVGRPTGDAETQIGGERVDRGTQWEEVSDSDSEAQTDVLMGKSDTATQVGRPTGDAETQIGGERVDQGTQWEEASDSDSGTPMALTETVGAMQSTSPVSDEVKSRAPTRDSGVQIGGEQLTSNVGAYQDTAPIGNEIRITQADKIKFLEIIKNKHHHSLAGCFWETSRNMIIISRKMVERMPTTFTNPLPTGFNFPGIFRRGGLQQGLGAYDKSDNDSIPLLDILENPDIVDMPPVWQTLLDFISYLSFFFFLYQCYIARAWVTEMMANNGLYRSYFSDLYTHHDREGRGILPTLFPEGVARFVEQFTLSLVRHFGIELQTYPMPG